MPREVRRARVRLSTVLMFPGRCLYIKLLYIYVELVHSSSIIIKKNPFCTEYAIMMVKECCCLFYAQHSKYSRGAVSEDDVKNGC